MQAIHLSQQILEPAGVNEAAVGRTLRRSMHPVVDVVEVDR
jgi:hypothetical protein